LLTLVTTRGPMLFDEVTEDMRRRALLAAATTALFGAPILGEVLELPERPNTRHRCRRTLPKLTSTG
jgi:hypothetical protein